jgi:hypothetical protein
MASKFVLAVFAAAAVVAAAAASAQQPAPAPAAAGAGCTGNVLFSDDFSQANDPAWQPNDTTLIGGGKLQGKSQVNYTNWAFNTAFPLADADICFDVSVSAVTDPNQGGALGGLVFWENDASKSLYELVVTPWGGGCLWRYYDWPANGPFYNGKVMQPVSCRAAPSLNKTAGAANSVRMTLKAGKISIYFNNQAWYTNISAPGEPKDGGPWGFMYASEQKNPNVWSFSNLKVTDPSQ